MLVGSLLLLSGCQIFGIFAQAMPNNVAAAYPGLKGNDVTVLVWTEHATATDWPAMAIDITAGVQNKLKAAQASDKPKELEGTTFPVTPQSVAKFQMTHPEAASMPIVDVAPIVGVKRLIYVEVTKFQTHSDMAVNTDLYRGQITAEVRVVELANGKAKIAYQDSVTAKYPGNAPTDGVTGLGDSKTYVGTLDAFCTVLAQRFYKHEEDPND